MQTRLLAQDQTEAPFAPVLKAAIIPTMTGTVGGAEVSLFNLNGGTIDTAKETWIVIHGWTQDPGDVGHVARQVEAQRPGAQVLMLDWSAADTSNDASTLDITPAVGAWAAGALADAGFPAGTINIVSYSYGVYVATELAKNVPGGVDVHVAIDPGYDAPGSDYDPATQGDLAANSKYSVSFYGDDVKGNIGVAQSADEAIALRNTNHNGAYWVVESLLDAADGDGGGADAFFDLSRLLAHTPAPWLPNQFNANGDNASGQFDAAIDTSPDGRIPTGIDAIMFTSGDDVVTLVGQAVDAHALGGDDVVNGSVGGDSLFGDEGADRLEGRDGADVLDGGDGADTLDGGAGGDAMFGGNGGDTYIVNSSSDTITETADPGRDLVKSTVSWFAGTNIESVQLTGAGDISSGGNGRDNSLIGNSGNNVLNGLGGADKINGGWGHDELKGGTGHDTLTGAVGRDHFIFASVRAVDSDVITDFAPIDDSIYLDNAVLTAVGVNGRLDAAAFWSNTTGFAHDANDRILYNTSTGELFYDSNGNVAGGRVLIATLTGAPALTFEDFVVI